MLALKLANSLVSYGEAKQNIYALNFDGTDESVNINPVSSDISTSAGTFSFWAKTGTMSATGTYIRALTDSNNHIIMIYHASSNQIRVAYKGGGTNKTAVITDAIENDGKWHHIAATWDTTADQLKIYLDGTLKATTTGLGTYSGGIASTSIGNNTAGANFINATLADVAIFTRVVPITELIASNHEPLNLTGSAGLIGYWRFDSGSGETAIDSSGKGFNGTLVNNPTWTTDVPYKAN
ncbi:MAG: putative concanavalin A-like lectin/glucanases superfamily protein [Prokaryotic dsDNA virus sp.]|nr:MAG: putative concanavalin A-like lectin/glucanases superfamily protein [Prokaryotic dsDNA virus sp.]|tara:strand:+ start:23722 stop:24435 length:714 start_codon:yes stop_codon:yes gene_type:complete